MTRTKKLNGGKLYVTYQDNGWVRYYTVYDDGAEEGWYDPKQGYDPYRYNDDTIEEGYYERF